MKALIHIGMPKTGSSAIQSWLNTNRKALAADGVAYARAHFPGRAFDDAHVELAVCVHQAMGELIRNPAVRAYCKLQTLADQAAFADAYRAHFETTLAGLTGDTCVLSSEYFGAGFRSPEHVAALHDWLQPLFDELHFVVYFRRQEDIATSSYSQRLRHGAVSNLTDLVRAASKMNYNKIVNRWAGVVGHDRITVRLLEPDALAGGDLILDFAQLLGVDPAGFKPPAFKNPALSRPALELIRAFNAKTSAFLQDGRRNPASVQIIRRIAREDARRDFPALTLSPEQITQVRNACRVTNKKLRAAWFPDRAQLFPPHPLAASDDIEQAVLAAQVADLSASVFSRRLPAPIEKARDGLDTILHRLGVKP